MSQEDCMPCRVIGSTVLLGTGGYLSLESFRTLQRSNRLIYGGLSAVFLSLGVYRAVTPVRPLEK